MLRVVTLFLFLATCCLSAAQTGLIESNLPVIVINTNGQSIQDEMKITVDMGIVSNGPGELNHLTDPFNGYDGKAGIERRGSTSQDLSNKKPYAIELRSDADVDTAVSLLGMPAETDWILLAPFSDKTLMRDALTYIWAGRTMEWAPHTRYCELVLDSVYQGVYILTEKIKRDDHRVDISKLTEDDNDGDELTGGYILKLDKCTGFGCDGFYSGYPVNPNSTLYPLFLYHYPRPDRITEAQKTYIQEWIYHFEDVMNSADFADPENGYRKYAEVGTFVDFLLINELTKNVDGYRLSTFFYKDKESVDGRMKMGPVWDFNIALGNADYCGAESPSGWALDFNLVCPQDGWQIPFWWKKMLGGDFEFRKSVKDRWAELRATVLSDARIFGDIDSIALLLDDAQERNFMLYPILDEYVWPNSFIGFTYAAEVEHLKYWLELRLKWMDATMDQLYLGLYKPTDYFTPVAYPNPGTGELFFDCYVHSSETVRIEIFNSTGGLCGELVDTQHFNGKNTFTWDQPLPEGVYFYRVFFKESVVGSGKILRY